MTLKEYRHYFALHYDQFVKEYNIQEQDIDKNVRYEKLIPADRITFNDAFFYFSDGRLKIIYLSDDDAVVTLWTEIKSTLDINAPDAQVRSRAGKTSNQLIFAKQGIAVSIHHDTPDFIELYPSQSLQDYLSNIYREVGPFIR